MLPLLPSNQKVLKAMKSLFLTSNYIIARNGRILVIKRGKIRLDKFYFQRKIGFTL